MLTAAAVLLTTLMNAGEPTAPNSADATRDLMQQATVEYNTSNYQAAIDSYTAAYAESVGIEDSELQGRVVAAIMFNLARAHTKAYNTDRDASHLRAAVELLEKYLGQTADLADELDAEQMKAAAEEELRRLEEEGASSPPPAPIPVAAGGLRGDFEPSERDPRAGRGLRIAGFSILGAGVVTTGALIGAGASISSSASSDWKRADSGAKLDDAKSRGQTGDTLMIAGAAAGGTLLVSGGVLTALGYGKRNASGVRVGLSGTSENVMVFAVGRF